ncbi:RepB family plasmid replication initiator protein [Vibrio sp. Makdt]|uniref:RepB family plasmid replication initiator protein n=1 Tax=Vibrio sp. Makdt TaxID=2998828 RepID=UPI0022CD6BE8|nr:RepB family plasmid replication initiator protein [Vibrio sp. Makdt]MDA0152425.1 RepB family plasmid replication initiator protein [Vibrio sp. Makdt]
MSQITKKDVLRQSNALTTAAYSLGRNEKRILYIALKHFLDNPIDYKSSDFGHVSVDIHTHHYASLFNSENASKEIAAAATAMKGKEVVFYIAEESLNEDRAYDSFTWMVKRSHRPKRGVTTFYFNAELISIITAVKSDFTKFLIGDAGELSSGHSMRLYESLKQWSNRRNSVSFSVKWMIERYCLPKSYERMSDFRRRFLKPSVEDIAKNTDIKLSYTEEKRNGEMYINFHWDSIIRDKSTQTIEESLSLIEQVNVIHCKLVANEEVTKKELQLLKKNLTAFSLAGGQLCEKAIQELTAL